MASTQTLTNSLSNRQDCQKKLKIYLGIKLSLSLDFIFFLRNPLRYGFEDYDKGEQKFKWIRISPLLNALFIFEYFNS
jgi:hypothetical protein